MRRILLLAAVAAMVLALTAGPALAFHFEGHRGGDTPDDKECNDSLTACQGGGGGYWPVGCNLETGECYTAYIGGGSHSTFDPATGDASFSGGGGGSNVVFDDNGEVYNDGGGSGIHCEGNYYTGEQDCVGTGYTGGPA